MFVPISKPRSKAILDVDNLCVKGREIHTEEEFSILGGGLMLTLASQLQLFPISLLPQPRGSLSSKTHPMRVISDAAGLRPLVH